MPLCHTALRTEKARAASLALVLIFGLLPFNGVITSPALATGFQSPPECLAYEGDAHLNCLYAFIELQKDKISKIEEELSQVQSTTQDLQSQVTRQATVTEELRRSLNQQERDYRYSPRLNVVPYLGFSFNFGRPYRYRHFGPRFFSPCFGPYYGPYGGCW